jgi:hypothetical protein
VRRRGAAAHLLVARARRGLILRPRPPGEGGRGRHYPATPIMDAAYVPSDGPRRTRGVVFIQYTIYIYVSYSFLLGTYCTCLPIDLGRAIARGVRSLGRRTTRAHARDRHRHGSCRAPSSKATAKIGQEPRRRTRATIQTSGYGTVGLAVSRNSRMYMSSVHNEYAYSSVWH